MVSLLVSRACSLWGNGQRNLSHPVQAEIVRRAQKSNELEDVAAVIMGCGLAQLRHWSLTDEQRVEVEAATLAALARPGALQSFKHDSAFSTWVERAAENHARNLYRSNDRYRAKNEKLYSTHTETMQRHSSLVATLEDFEAAKSQLPTKHQDVIELWLEHESYSSISRETGVALTTVRGQVIRAHEELEKVLRSIGYAERGSSC